MIKLTRIKETYSYLLFVVYLSCSLLLISCNQQKKINHETVSEPKVNLQIQKNEAPFLILNSKEQLSGVVRDIFQDSKNNLWFGTQSGAFRLQDSAFVLYDKITDHLGNKVTIKDIAEDKNGNIWFGHMGGISKYDGNTITNYSEKDGLISNDVWSICIDKNDVVWIGTLQGVCTFKNNKFKAFHIPEAKADPTRGISSAKIVHSIMEDSKGKIWFGTNGGAYNYDGKTLVNISEKDGLCNNNVNRILEDHNGQFWFATTHNGLCVFNGKSFTNISEQNEINDTEIWDIYQDNSNNIWVSGKHFGVYRYDGTSFRSYHENEGLKDIGVMSIFQDKDGNIWCGGMGGLFRLEDKSFVNITKNGPWQYLKNYN